MILFFLWYQVYLCVCSSVRTAEADAEAAESQLLWTPAAPIQGVTCSHVCRSVKLLRTKYTWFYTVFYTHLILHVHGWDECLRGSLLIEPIPCKDGPSAKSLAFTSALVVVETAHTVPAKALEKKKNKEKLTFAHYGAVRAFFLSVSELIVNASVLKKINK